VLGAFALTGGDGAPIPIASPRAQSLLAYLALNRGVPQSRRQISFLLWPDSPESQAHNNLRQLLHQLRRSWAGSDGFVTGHGGALALETGPDLAIDIDDHELAVAAATAADDESQPGAARKAFEDAVDSYGGVLLPAVYDEWILPERERLADGHLRVLDRLIGLLEQQGDYRSAIERANQRLRLDPLDERVVRWLMRLHATNQDRAGALRVYQACVTVLADELGVEPDRATRELSERILGLEPATDTIAPPRPIRDAPPPARPTPRDRPSDGLALIGRRPEWARLMAAWDRMATGEPQLVVIGGEAGIGKTRLAVELCDWADRSGIGSARTRAYAAEGRLSFAPIADWLRNPLLAPTLPRLDVGSLSEVSRLLPELLVQRPDLPRPSARIEDWQRQAFFQALARAFLAAEQPLLLVLDDLQWCDADTLEWLHFLFRFDRHARVLVAGTVRPDEIDRAHPMAVLAAALRDDGQLAEIALGPLDAAETSQLAAQVSGRALRPEQAIQIHLETEGNPLFVVETIRAGLMDVGGDRGGAPGDGNGPPAEGPNGGARRLAPKVQAVIGARLAQLSEPAHDLAALAATVGRAFSLAVIRESGTGDEDRLVAGFDELVRRQIVREQGNDAYDFTHDRIREVAYAEPTEARRRLLHRRVAEALERVHAAGLDAVAAQIAAHFANAGFADRGAAYYQRAAEVAQRIGANLEAIGLIHRGLALLESRPVSHERDDRELGLQVALGASMVATEGYGSSDVAAVFARARRLCQTLGRPTTSPILRGLAMSSLAQVKIDDCHALGDHMLSLAELDDDPVQRVEAHYVIAMALLLSGRAAPARVELEAALGHYDRARSAEHVGLYSQDPEVVCKIRLGLDLWLLGDPVGSAKLRAEGLRRAEELGHPFSRAYALVWDAKLQTFIGDAALARTQAEAALELGRDYAMPFWLTLATVLRGWAVAEEGDIEAGIAGMREGMAAYAATGGHAFVTLQLGLLGEQYGRLGDVEQGLAILADGLALADRTDERWCEPELHRRRGDLLGGIAGRDGDAEAAYLKAVEVARYQGARALELRAATHLGELWLRHDRPADASRLVVPIVGAFSTLMDSSLLPDLARARAIVAVPDSGETRST
jgi:DNA-binding SARP family transcriptional activator/predicted ATPase